MWNLRNITNEHGGGEEKRGANHKRLLTLKKNLRVDGGRWVVDGLDG